MQKGFTIIELLIVIVIIGILAGIGIVSFNGAQKRGQDASVQHDLQSIAAELESYRTRDPVGNPTQRFPFNTTHLLSLEIQAAKGSYDTTIPHNMLYCGDPGTFQGFKLLARSKSGKIFLIDQDGFKSHSFTAANMDTNFCSTQSMGGTMPGYSNGSWATWVRTG